MPNGLIALQDIMKERRRKQKEILHLQRINTIKYLQEKSPIGNPTQDPNNSGINMFLNQSFKNQTVGFNFEVQPQSNYGAGNNGQTKIGINNNQSIYNNQNSIKDHDDLELIKKLEEEARKEKVKTNQNLSKLLSLVEIHNGNLEEIETKLKKEFSDIKENMKKIKVYQKENEKKIQENIMKKKLESNQQQPEYSKPEQNNEPIVKELYGKRTKPASPNNEENNQFTSYRVNNEIKAEKSEGSPKKKNDLNIDI